MGDAVASAGFALLTGESGVALDVLGKVKIATGETRKGLSTGENDYAIQTDFFLLSRCMTPFATLGYESVGRPAGTQLRDVWYASAGASWKLSEITQAGLLADSRQASRPGANAGRELSVFVGRKLAATTRLQVYPSRGFGDTVPTGAPASCSASPDNRVDLR